MFELEKLMKKTFNDVNEIKMNILEEKKIVL